MKERLNRLELCRMYYEEGAKDEKKRNKAFGLLCQAMYNTIRHEVNITYDFYGKDEIKWSGIEYDDLINAGVIGLSEGLEHFKFKPDDFCSAVFRSYMHLYIKGAIRRCIQKTNGVSQYYCGLLIRMKMRGLDFDMTDEELSAGLGEKMTTVENLRYTFRANKKIPYDGAIADLEDVSQDIESRCEKAEFAEKLVELIKGAIPKEDLPFFFDRFLAEEPLSRAACVKKYGITYEQEKRKEAIAKMAVQKVFMTAGISGLGGEVMIQGKTNLRYEQIALKELGIVNILEKKRKSVMKNDIEELMIN